jgi:DNA-binding IclR family transcriptional regulator
MANTGAGDAPGSDIQAVARAGQICALFGPDTTELTAADVSQRLGLNRTTAYRYCASMVTAGILDRGPSKGTFVLGELMLRIGIAALRRRPVVDLAPPHLVRLSAATRMTAVLSLWSSRGPLVTLVEEDRTRPAVVTVRPGTVLDRTAAQARVFLAHQPDHVGLDTLAEGATPAERAELEAAIYTARRTGYSITELPGGVIAAAAPVFGADGIAATVGLLGTDSSVDLSAQSVAVTELLSTTTSLTTLLTGTPT